MRNKGFSLIELIIVIAIMAILVAVIAPNLTKYLARSKEETDLKNLDEVRHQTLNTISEAATKDVEVVDISGGSVVAIYHMKIDASTGKAKVDVVSDGVSDFAILLTESLEESMTSSSKDKTKNKIEIKISKNLNNGYDVDVYFVS